MAALGAGPPFTLCPHRYCVPQHQTKLYVVHIGAVSEEFFYQQALQRWGNLALIRYLYLYHTDTEGWVPRTSLELPDTAHVPQLGQHTSHIVPHTDHSTHI